MSTVSAGLVKVTNLTVSSTASGAVQATNLTADNVTATTLVSNNFSFNNNLDVSGNMSVDGTTTLAATVLAGTTSVRGPLTTPAGVSLDVSGNMTLPGTFTNPVFVTVNQLQDNTLMSAESVYTANGETNGQNYQYPIFGLQADVPIGIFTNTTNTVVSEEFLTKNPDTDCSGGKIYYYNGDGTPSAPIDGTAGTPHFSGVYGNIGTPIFVDVDDTSAYKIAIQKTFKKAPAITDGSGNNVGGALVNMNYSTYADEQGLDFDGMKELCDTVYRFYTKRGWSLNPPQYTEYDGSGNNSDINYFTQDAGVWSGPPGPLMGIEFIYDENMDNFPLSSINLCFASVFYNPDPNTGGYEPIQYWFGIGPKSLSDAVAGVRPPVNIPVTTDKSVYGKAVINGTDSVYYDYAKGIININYVSGNTWNYVIDSSNFGIQRNVQHNMISFKGAYAAMRPSLSTFESNGYTVPGLVSCSPYKAAAVLVQISPEIVSVDQTIVDGVDYEVQTFVNPLIDGYTDEYLGASMVRAGYGNIGSGVNVINTSTLNSYFDFTNKLIVSQTPTTQRPGQNPYNNFYQSTATGGNIAEFANPNWKNIAPKFNFDLYSTTPESMTLLDASFCTLTDNVTADVLVAIHELLHLYEGSLGTVFYGGNTEAHAVCFELDGHTLGTGVTVPFRMIRTSLVYLNSQFKGWYPLSKAAAAYSNNLYSATKLGIANQTYPALTPNISSSQYGEFYVYRYFADHYDVNQQIIRRQNEIAICNMNLLTSNGFSSFGDTPTSCITTSQFAYAQALWEVSNAIGTPKELPDGYSEYVMSSAFLRNNASIPEQYRFIYPIWLANKNNQFSSFIGEITTAFNGVFPQVLDMYMWSDLDGSNPVLLENYGRAATNASSLKYVDGECILPFWPRNAAGDDQFNMGSWRRNSAGRLIDSSDNLIYNTATGVKNLSAGPPVWTPSAVAYKTSQTVYLESLSSVAYVLPVAGNSGLGVTATMTGITVSVARGNWNFAVAQFVPDGSGGSWTQLPSSGNFYNIDNPGTWTDASGEIYDGVQTSYLDASSAVTYTFDLSGLSVQTFNGVKYYPKLVCVNATLDDYGQYLNVAPARCRYSGKVTITPTFA
jgi:hypothetical protein